MNILLIDDEALQGWKEVIEKVLFNGLAIETALNRLTATSCLNTKKYDLIVLDIRLGEADHQIYDIKKLGGYELLSKEIRSSFDKKNYATPVLLMTASNKIWNINEMIEIGADDYYIKEHPDTANDLDFSRSNYIRLKGNKEEKGSIEILLELGKKRHEIIVKINEIITESKSKIENENIRNRIEEKLKIGYGLLFKKATKLEKHKLLFSNESLAFVVFWSILEEIAKDFFSNNWQLDGKSEGSMKDNKWVIKSNKEIFIEDLIVENNDQRSGNLNIGIKWDGIKYIKNSTKIPCNDKYINYYTGKINLSLQIYAIMLLGKSWQPEESKNLFEPLNEYRNKVDFIHSSVSAIFKNSVVDIKNNELDYKKCIDMLSFILKVIN